MKKRRCYYLLFQGHLQPHPLVLGAEELNPMELGQLRQQYAEQ